MLIVTKIFRVYITPIVNKKQYPKPFSVFPAFSLKPVNKDLFGLIVASVGYVDLDLSNKRVIDICRFSREKVPFKLLNLDAIDFEICLDCLNFSLMKLFEGENIDYPFFYSNKLTKGKKWTY